MSLKGVPAKRELNGRRMQEIYNASLRADTDSPGWTNFLSQYPDVAGIAEAFDAAHLKVIQDPASDFDMEDRVRTDFDKWHYAINAKYYTLTADAPAPRPPAGASDSGSASKVKLPKISLPGFSGDLSRWPSYFALFNTAHSRQKSTFRRKFGRHSNS